MVYIKDIDIQITWSNDKKSLIEITDLPFNVDDFIKIKQVLKEYESWHHPKKNDDIHAKIDKTIMAMENANHIQS